VTGDLRSAIRDAIDNATCTHAGDYFREHGIHIDACTECEVDAVVAVVEPRLWRSRNVVNGRCRYCGTNSDRGKQHRMYCRHYVGPLEHRWVRERYNGTFGGLDHECQCGGSVRVGGIAGTEGLPACPNVDQDWRGPRSEEAV
jgi:hypothetical protein